MPKVLIVGGGISGLSAAYYLNKAGVRATLPELPDEKAATEFILQTYTVTGAGDLLPERLVGWTKRPTATAWNPAPRTPMRSSQFPLQSKN